MGEIPDITRLPEYYTFDESRLEDNCLMVKWDYMNSRVDKLMRKEVNPGFGDNLNMMWIQKLKEVAGWRNGEMMYSYLKTNGDGYFCIWYSKDKKFANVNSVIVEPNGYASRLYFNHYTDYKNEDDNIKYSIMIRTESLYNDWVCGQLNE